MTSPASPIPPPTKTPFRFKRKRASSPSQPTTDRNATTHRDASPQSSHRSSHRRRHHHRHHHGSPRHQAPPPHSPEETSPFHKDPDTAFRESLFDAMADDEGAAFWEGVYGQPIHQYSPYYRPTSSTNDTDPSSEPPNPETENVHKMTEEDYVAYVRGKMWEKSHGYIFEERARREEVRRRGRRKVQQLEEGEQGEWNRGVEEALKRGEERRRRNKWKAVWQEYVRGWEGVRWGDVDMNEGVGEGENDCGLRGRIPWPVESGRWEDVEKERVETFYGKAATAVIDRGKNGFDLGEVLKKERVRWHPDKMQQRAGEGGIDAETLKLVTAVFQVVDRMWGEVKGKKG